MESLFIQRWELQMSLELRQIFLNGIEKGPNFDYKLVMQFSS